MFLTAVGVWFFLPLLPIFLGRKGGSAALVGEVFAAGLLANALIRYPAGWAADRFGSRPVLVVSLLTYAGLFLAYLLPLPPVAFIVVRFLHSAAGGAYWPAANGLLADSTSSKERGRAFGMMQATNTAGMLLGPGIGGFIALTNLNTVFVISAVMSVLATIAIATLPNAHVHAEGEVPKRALHIARVMLPLLLLGAGTSYMIGTYDTIWPLYMTYRGGNTLAVGISFAVFAIPVTFLSPQMGALGDRFGHVRFVVVALLGTAIFAAVYPFVSSVPWLIGLGFIEGMFTLGGTPSLMAEVSRSAPKGQQGRTQGVFQTVQTAVQIVGALAGGALFGLNPGYSFFAIAFICALSALAALRGSHLKGAATRKRPLPVSPSR